jgi:hypothetical protein
LRNTQTLRCRLLEQSDNFRSNAVTGKRLAIKIRSEGKLPIFAADELQMKSEGKLPVFAAGNSAAAREMLSPRAILLCAPRRIHAQGENTLAMFATLPRTLIHKPKCCLVISGMAAPVAVVNLIPKKVV